MLIASLLATGIPVQAVVRYSAVRTRTVRLVNIPRIASSAIRAWRRTATVQFLGPFVWGRDCHLSQGLYPLQ